MEINSNSPFSRTIEPEYSTSEATCYPKTYPSFPLLPPFYEKTAIDINTETDLYTKQTFLNLIKERKKQDFLPTFLVVARDTTGNILTYEGTRYVKEYLNSNSSKLNSLTACIYVKNETKEKAFRYLKNVSEIRNNNEHLLKYINASDPDSPPEKRGPDRYYIAGCFFRNLFQIKQQFSKSGEPFTDEKREYFESHIHRTVGWTLRTINDNYYGGYILKNRLIECGLVNNKGILCVEGYKAQNDQEKLELDRMIMENWHAALDLIKDDKILKVNILRTMAKKVATIKGHENLATFYQLQALMIANVSSLSRSEALIP